MKIIRTGIDRRSNINRRLMMLTSFLDRRKEERRESGERRDLWVRFSEWSSVNLDLRNRYFWELLK
ncbi:MAG: hypothetical protein KKF12_00920 [Proteobacteria bacterium]|nr:hypothetical protein [Desulfobacula sp.]MBU3954332.1 hypothetical protein [Pseudomonadota bacterium]MBU4129360.1 hypothetical protein [Pseudomonadota bacterium]